MSQPPQGLPPHGQGGGWGPPPSPQPQPGPYGPPPGPGGGWPQQPAPGYGEQPTQVGGFRPIGQPPPYGTAPGNPPGWGGAGGPAGPGWPPPGPGPSSGQGGSRGLLIAGIIVLVVAALVVTVLALVVNRGDSQATAARPTVVSTPATSSAAPRTSPPAAAPPPAGAVEVEEFLATLPIDFTDCAEADLAGDGDLLSAECGEARTQPGPSGARFYLYPDVATLDEVFAKDVEGSGLTEFPADQDCSTGTGFGAWEVEGVVRGQVACTIVQDDTVSIAWTDDEFRTEGIVSVPGTTQADVAELYSWWVDNSYYQG